MAPTRSNDIADWNSSIEDDASSASGLARPMKDWTIAEYRQYFLDLIDSRQRASKPTASFPCCECGAEYPTAKDLIQHAREEAPCPHCPEKFECHGQLLLYCEGTELICRHCCYCLECLGLLREHSPPLFSGCNTCNTVFKCDDHFRVRVRGSHCKF
jgi:hypothetical protein